MDTHAAATWDLVKSWQLTDRGKLLVFFYAAQRAGVVIPDRLVDAMVFLLRKSHLLPVGYSFQYRTLPQSPELHDDLFVLEQSGEIRHGSPLSISSLGAKWVENDVGSSDGFPAAIERLSQGVAAYRDWDEERFFVAVYAAL